MTGRLSNLVLPINIKYFGESPASGPLRGTAVNEVRSEFLMTDWSLIRRGGVPSGAAAFIIIVKLSTLHHI
jgi:hypothetical protein